MSISFGAFIYFYRFQVSCVSLIKFFKFKKCSNNKLNYMNQHQNVFCEVSAPNPNKSLFQGQCHKLTKFNIIECVLLLSQKHKMLNFNTLTHI